VAASFQELFLLSFSFVICRYLPIIVA